MPIHKLVLNDIFDEVICTLIAVHCTIEDYRLAFLLNKCLGITLSRKSSDLDHNNGKSTYSIFEWEDKKQLTTWNLVSNVCKTETYQQTNYKSLFDNQKIIKKTNLIPEYKHVTYFLKVDNPPNLGKQNYILKKVIKIPQILTAYNIDSNKLKSKDNLIFN